MMRASRWLNHLGSMALDLVFPALCVGCQLPGEVLCARCAQRVERAPQDFCIRCQRVQIQSGRLCADCASGQQVSLLRVAAALHTFPMREAIHALKYDGRRALAAPLARYLVAAFDGQRGRRLPHSVDGVVPVPLHALRLAERGYNQSHLLAASFCERTGLPLHAEWLERTRSTRQQVGLGPKERRQNVAGAFVAAPQVAGKVLLVIDDVCTTGSTLEECAAVALAAGAKAVYGLTLAMPTRGDT